MNEYKIIKTNVESYDRLVVLLTFENLFTYMREIERSLSEADTGKTILIDQLLITGDCANRFVSCRFKNGKFDLRTTRTVIPAKYYRKKTVEFLHDNYCYVENSILNETQRQKLRDKIVF